MKGNQLPILQNRATTGHKLQGSGVETLLVHKWSKETISNYLMLSSVQNMTGVYGRQKWPENIATYLQKSIYDNMISKLE
jgi:hypothetical protein